MLISYSRKGIFCLIVILLIGAFIIPSISSDGPGSGNTVYVDDDADPSWYTPTQVKTIQEGVNNASVGDTVFVYKGTYFENVVVDKSINLIGEDRDKTIIDGGGSGNVVYVSANYVNISNFTLTNSSDLGSYSGLFLMSHHTNISNNNISNNNQGIYLHSISKYTTIDSNFISKNDYGVRIGSNNNTLRNNNISKSTNFGIYLDSSNDNELFNNTISKNFYGIYIHFTSANNIIRNNRVIKNIHFAVWAHDLSYNNTFYNNYFNNTNNAHDEGYNNWNITKTLGYNIIQGPYLGGNYWDYYTGIDTDIPPDGIGDTNIPHDSSTYIWNGGDYLPLVTYESLPVYNLDTGEGFFTIQEAIDDSDTKDDPDDPDTIYVKSTYSGTCTENIVVYKSLELWGQDRDTTIIDGGGSGDVVNITADNVTIRGFTIQNSGYGSHDANICIWANNTKIIKNNITNNDLAREAYGIYSQGWSGSYYIGQNLNISYNTLWNNYVGIGLSYSINTRIHDNKIISSNTVSHHYAYAISCYKGDNSVISFNNISTITGCRVGIDIEDCDNTKISYNSIWAHPGIYFSYGMNIWYNSNENIITGNTVQNSVYGIKSNFLSSPNMIYHNNFMNNDQNALCYNSDNWDNGYSTPFNPLTDGGNYWDDYTGVDKFSGPNQDIPGPDGIGDKPYDIPGDSNKDNYPFMEPGCNVKISEDIVDEPVGPTVRHSLGMTLWHMGHNATMIEEFHEYAIGKGYSYPWSDLLSEEERTSPETSTRILLEPELLPNVPKCKDNDPDHPPPEHVWGVCGDDCKYLGSKSGQSEIDLPLMIEHGGLYRMGVQFYGWTEYIGTVSIRIYPKGQKNETPILYDEIYDQPVDVEGLHWKEMMLDLEAGEYVINLKGEKRQWRAPSTVVTVKRLIDTLYFTNEIWAEMPNEENQTKIRDSGLPDIIQWTVEHQLTDDEKENWTKMALRPASWELRRSHPLLFNLSYAFWCEKIDELAQLDWGDDINRPDYREPERQIIYDDTWNMVSNPVLIARRIAELRSAIREVDNGHVYYWLYPGWFDTVIGEWKRNVLYIKAIEDAESGLAAHDFTVGKTGDYHVWVLTENVTQFATWNITVRSPSDNPIYYTHDQRQRRWIKVGVIYAKDDEALHFNITLLPPHQPLSESTKRYIYRVAFTTDENWEPYEEVEPPISVAQYMWRARGLGATDNDGYMMWIPDRSTAAQGQYHWPTDIEGAQVERNFVMTSDSWSSLALFMRSVSEENVTVEIDAGPLTGDNGIYADRLDWHVQAYTPSDGTSWLTFMLMHRPYITIPALNNAALYLTINTDEVPAGEYIAEVIMTGETESGQPLTPRQIILNVRVSEIEIAPNEPVLVWGWKAPPEGEIYMQDWSEHGINVWHDTMSKEDMDARDIKLLIIKWDETKSNESTQIWIENLVAELADMGVGYDDFVIIIGDEPAINLENYINTSKAIKYKDPNVRIAFNPGEVASRKTFEDLDSHCDFWIPFREHLKWEPRTEIFTKKPYMWYNEIVKAYRTSNIPEDMYDWIRSIPSKEGEIKGFAFYAFNAPGRDHWDIPYPSSGSDHAIIVLPSRYGPVPTRTWEAIREAIQHANLAQMVKEHPDAQPLELDETIKKLIRDGSTQDLIEWLERCNEPKIEVKVHLRNSTGVPRSGGIVQYYGMFGWRYFNNTDTSGQATKRVPIDTTRFRMEYKGVLAEKTQNIVSDPVVIFNTTNVTVILQNNFTKDKVNLGRVFRLPLYKNGERWDDWKKMGTTGSVFPNGEVHAELLARVHNFQMIYKGIKINKTQDIGENPIVIFNTTLVTVKLLNDTGNSVTGGIPSFLEDYEIDGSPYTYEYWNTIDAPDQHGGKCMQLLPVIHKFRMYYCGGIIFKTQDIAKNPIVIFNTTKVTVRLQNNITKEEVSGGIVSVWDEHYKKWNEIGQTDLNGKLYKELLKKTIIFNMSYGGEYTYKEQDIGINPIVIFNTTTVIKNLNNGVNFIDAIAEMDTNVTVEVNNPTDITLKKYAENPHPEAQLNNALNKFIEIIIDDESVVVWPINITIYYTQDDFDNPPPTEDDLVGIYFWNVTENEWQLYKNTGVNRDYSQGDYVGYCWAEARHLTLLVPGGDNIPPETTKTTGDPKYGDNDEWITSYTEFNLTATDNLSGINKTYYRIWYNSEWIDWKEYTGNFTLSGEGKHYVEFYSIDNVGNKEEVKNQTHYVDQTPFSGYIKDQIIKLEELETPPGAKKKINKSIDKLNQAIDAFNDNDTAKAIGKIEKAVEHLMNAQDKGADTQAIIDDLVELVKTIVDKALEDAIEIVGSDHSHVVKAQQHYSKALDKIAEEKYDKAINKFQKAYEKAMKARGEWVPASFIVSIENDILNVQIMQTGNISSKALALLVDAEEKLNESLAEANNDEFKKALTKTKQAVKKLEKALNEDVNTTPIIESLMLNIKDAVHQKITDTEYIVGTDNSHIIKAWDKFNVAVTKWNEGKYEKAIDRFIDAAEKVKDALG